ncbi:MAG: hypothetical protein WCL16_03555, partial [bacterium]
PFSSPAPSGGFCASGIPDLKHLENLSRHAQKPEDLTTDYRDITDGTKLSSRMFCIIRAISVIRGAKLLCLMPIPSGGFCASGMPGS